MTYSIKNKVFCCLFLCGILANNVFSQSDTITYEVGTHGILSTGQHSPFWFQNNQFGDVSHEANSAVLELNLSKTMQHPGHLFDYSFSFTGHFHEHENKAEFEWHEYYLNSRLWIFNLCVGSRLQSHGNQDETLSGGGLLFSNNSGPMPKIFVGIENFTPVLFKSGIVEIKGGISHGWFTDNIYTKNMLLHHKYAYLRLGGKKSPVNFQYGLDHAAEWGGIVPGYGQQPTSVRDFLNVFLARSGSVSGVHEEQINVGGNHLISQSMRLDYRLHDFEFGAYWQNINEDKPILLPWDAVNIADGLWGFSVKNRNIPVIKGFLYEYLNTTDQNGPYHDKDGIVYGGGDSYFDNYLYRNGWTYFGRTIGTPFITSPVYNTDGSVYVQNNRVQVHHFGVEGEVGGYGFRVLNSYSKNYGTYSAPYQGSRDAVNLLIEADKHFEKWWGIDAGLSVGADFGQMYGQNFGVMIRISKSGDLFKF